MNRSMENVNKLSFYAESFKYLFIYLFITPERKKKKQHFFLKKESSKDMVDEIRLIFLDG